MHGAWILRSVEVVVDGRPGLLVLKGEDLSAAYPGMVRYTLEFRRGEDVLYTYRTNTYEYPPGTSQTAESVALTAFHRLRQELPDRPEAFVLHPPEPAVGPLPLRAPSTAVVLQGSPRQHGNSAILAGWTTDACRDAGLRCETLCPAEMRIEECTGCFRCYNAGRCVIDDDMVAIYRTLAAVGLVIVCTPVYAETVPAALKAVIDRCQAYRARRLLTGGESGRQAGILCAVSGQVGAENFVCVSRVAGSFFRLIGAEMLGEVLVDGADAVNDIRTVAGKEEGVRAELRALISRVAD
ncbi:flavodoxin family protein [uncultured Methanofollis sp.]|uniref:flavodoxin family protein n=1 Tax=uncultured Methanofollis sp. TaxID=262500 RepID=UPI002601E779|nr:flavodoxin family protein [uncultured Methanofollis sp.]